ncbi:MAG TPA: hypothetical protein VFO82_16440 [Steroidobacteraceae bacterium]|nr:hypothetical protein [Steroidobacteraceae bacterium]
MSATRETLAERLNRSCDCTLTDMPALQRRLNLDAATHPHLFSEAPVFLDPGQAGEMQRIVAAIEAVIGLPAYQQRVLQGAPEIARARKNAVGVFMGFDFHLASDGPQLIEINTNAGGAFLNVAARAAQQSCCSVADNYLAALPTAHQLEDELYAMFQREWVAARGERPLRSIAIVDENPAGQYLYPEFLLARQLFDARGIVSRIVGPEGLEIRDGVLLAHGEPVDLVYNRLTDFYLADPRHHALRSAYEHDLAVVTPHPRAHALYADKHNLTLLSDAQTLRELGVTETRVALLTRSVPYTRSLGGGEQHWWSDRKGWFFKPRHGFGSRGAYRGDKLTRRVFADMMSGDYLAQRLTPPSERWRSRDDVRQPFKVDVRCFVYAGRVQLMAARLYQGQTTNFRTAGGGFAPVYVVGAAA